jgi:hypothetical protein
MKFETIEITGTRRVVFTTCRRANGKDKDISTIWNRIPSEEYSGEADLDDYFDDFVWVDETRDRIRSDRDMIELLKKLQYSHKFRLWSHNETINVTYK